MKYRADQIAENIIRFSVAPDDRFSFNHFLILDQHPILIHTGRVQWFEIVQSMMRQWIGPEQLRYITFSHFEADECGSLNHWLKIAPHAEVLVGPLGKSSMEDFSSRGCQVVTDQQRIQLGKRQLIVLETPHFPHNWDACLFYEPQAQVLFNSDLDAHLGFDDVMTQEDRTSQILQFQAEVGFMSLGPFMNQAISKIESLPIQLLATQHGATLQGASNIQALFQGLKNIC